MVIRVLWLDSSFRLTIVEIVGWSLDFPVHHLHATTIMLSQVVF